MLSPSTIDLLDISNSNGKEVMIKATEVKMIVAPRTAPPLPFGSLSRKFRPSDSVSLLLCIYLIYPHWVLPYLK